MKFKIFYQADDKGYHAIVNQMSQQLTEEGHHVTKFPADADDEGAFLNLWRSVKIDKEDIVIIYFHGSNFHAGPMTLSTLEFLEVKKPAILFLLSCNSLREIENGEFLSKSFGLKFFEKLGPQKMVCANAEITISSSPRVLYLAPTVKIIVGNKPKDNFNSLYLFFDDNRSPKDLGGKFQSFTQLLNMVQSS